jgi:hypothetical protein
MPPQQTTRLIGTPYSRIRSIITRAPKAVGFVRFQAALLEGRYDVVRTSDCICRVNRGLNPCGQLFLVCHRLNDLSGLLEAFRIHIHEHDRAILQSRSQQDVITKIASEDETSSPDKRDFCHELVSLWFE